MKTCSDSMRSQGRDLENLFFHQQDAALLEQRKELARMERTRKALSDATGITNPHVLQNLVDLEIDVEKAAALAFVPLLEVAWADGELNSKERAAVLAGAAQCGICVGSLPYALVEGWLTCKPPDKLLVVWTHYIRGLCECLSDEEKKALKDALMKQTRTIAQASGGFLGLSKISPAEEDMLIKLDSAFEVPS